MENKNFCWEVAGLTVRLNPVESDLSLETPPGHKKFLKPSPITLPFSRQSGESSTAAKLDLYIRDNAIDPVNTQGAVLLRSDTWEFWINPNGAYEFVLPYEEIPIIVSVKQDFSEGIIQGEFSSSKAAIFPLKNIENRIFSAWLGSLGDIILHASGIALEGKGYCFAGNPGAGKSTLAAALAAFPNVTVLGEDQVVLRYLENRFWIFGAPWHLNPDMCSPEGVPLEKLFFLARSLKPGAEQITPLDGITRILQTAFIPFYQPQWMPGILEHLELLAQQVPFYTLGYQLGTDPVQLIING